MKKKTLALKTEICIILTQMNGNCADERRGRESTQKRMKEMATKKVAAKKAPAKKAPAKKAPAKKAAKK